MAKSRRTRKEKVRASQASATRRAPIAARSPAQGIPARPKVAPAAEKALRPTHVDFRAEYRYVVNDLKRLGITALAMFVVMTVLSAII